MRQLFHINLHSWVVCGRKKNSISGLNLAQITKAGNREAAKLTVMNSGKKTVQNPVHVVQNPMQTAAANDSKRLHEIKDGNSRKRGFCDDNTEKTKACDSMRITGLSNQMGWAGFEPAKAYANGFTARPL